MQKHLLFLVFTLISLSFHLLGSPISKIKADHINDGFIINKGQLKNEKGEAADKIFLQYKNNKNIEVYLDAKGLSYLFLNSKEKETEKGFETSMIQVHLEGATISKENIVTEYPSEFYFNYYYPHCPEGITNIRLFQKVTIKNIYPNIDWVLYNATDQGMKYDFVIHKGGNPDNIHLVYKSSRETSLDKSGNIISITELGELKENTPYAYQKEFSNNVQCHYQVKKVKDHEYNINFNLSNWDRSQDLIIDPELTWSTYFGGPSYEGYRDIVLDEFGFLYIIGYSWTGFTPTEEIEGGYFDRFFNGGNGDGMITKFDPFGNLLWSTYIGGAENDEAHTVDVTSSGSIYVTGFSESLNFPVMNIGGAFNQNFTGTHDCFLTQFNRDGELTWSTAIGGSGADGTFHINLGASNLGQATTVDQEDNLYLAFFTTSNDIPLVDRGGTSYQQDSIAGNRDVFIAKFNANNEQVWGTHFGGNGDDAVYDMQLNDAGDLYLCGRTTSEDFPIMPYENSYLKGTIGDTSNFIINSFISMFDKEGELKWSTYFGDDSGYTYATNLAIDSRDKLYLTGEISTIASLEIKELVGAYNKPERIDSVYNSLFIARHDHNNGIEWSTYFGGTFNESFMDILVDSINNLYTIGTTNSRDFELVDPGAGFFDSDWSSLEGFISKFKPSGELCWSTYFGGNGWDWLTSSTIDNEFFYITGEVTSDSFHITGELGYMQPSFAGLEDMFVSKFKIYDEYYDTTEICDQDSILLNGQYEKESGNYITGSRTTCNIDSLIYMHLIVNPFLPEYDCFWDQNAIFVPNAFSPTGENVTYNLLTDIEIPPYYDLTFQIFNRMGQLIFSTNDKNISWDGNYRKKKAAAGVYQYILTLSSGDQVLQQGRGNITLLR